MPNAAVNSSADRSRCAGSKKTWTPRDRSRYGMMSKVVQAEVGARAPPQTEVGVGQCPKERDPKSDDAGPPLPMGSGMMSQESAIRSRCTGPPHMPKSAWGNAQNVIARTEVGWRRAPHRPKSAWGRCPKRKTMYLVFSYLGNLRPSLVQEPRSGKLGYPRAGGSRRPSGRKIWPRSRPKSPWGLWPGSAPPRSRGSEPSRWLGSGLSPQVIVLQFFDGPLGPLGGGSWVEFSVPLCPRGCLGFLGA